MIRAVIFDCFGVLIGRNGVNQKLLDDVVTLKKSGLKLGVLSNMAKDEIGELIGAENYTLFDHVLVSGEIGVAKPDERAFLLAARRLGEFPSDCLMVDDSLANCTATEAVGMKATHYVGYDDFVLQFHNVIH